MRHKFYFTILILAVISTFAFYKHPTINFGQKNTIEIPSDTITNRDILAAIQNNTFTDPVDSGFDNIYGLATIALAALAFIVSIFTFWAQLNTEEHTKNTPYRVQEGILRDLPRHLYRNLICTLAMIRQYEQYKEQYKNKEIDDLYYPSEANVLKLQTLPEEILLKMDISDKDSEKIYADMHEKTLLFRNYNNEILSASQHFKQRNITEDSIHFDYDNLLFKPIYLMNGTKELSQTFTSISGFSKHAQTTETIFASILVEHILKGKPIIDPQDERLNNSDLIKQLEGNDNDTGFPFTVFCIPDLKQGDKKDPIERSFRMLFTKKYINVKVLVNLATSIRKNKDKEKVEFFINQILDGKVKYGNTWHINRRDVNMWNLFKIMCYLDSTAEMEKIGMINVA